MFSFTATCPSVRCSVGDTTFLGLAHVPHFLLYLMASYAFGVYAPMFQLASFFISVYKRFIFTFYEHALATLLNYNNV